MGYKKRFIISIASILSILYLNISFNISFSLIDAEDNIVSKESTEDKMSIYQTTLKLDSKFGRVENFKMLTELTCRDVGMISGELISEEKINSLRWGFFDSKGKKILIEEKNNLDTHNLNFKDYLEDFRFSRLGVGEYIFRMYLTTEKDRYSLGPISIKISPNESVLELDKAVLNMKYINISQAMDVGSHEGSYAIDLVGLDRGIDSFYSPFDGIVKKIYSVNNQQNFVWLESKKKYQFPDASFDYITLMTGHDYNISDLYIGKEIIRGENYYQEGNSGKSTGNHIHLEVGKGKTTSSGWHKNQYGKYQIDNQVKVNEILYIKDSSTVINDRGLNFNYTQLIIEEIE